MHVCMVRIILSQMSADIIRSQMYTTIEICTCCRAAAVLLYVCKIMFNFARKCVFSVTLHKYVLAVVRPQSFSMCVRSCLTLRANVYLL